MNAAVLVLDVGMRPLRVVPWRQTVRDMLVGKVEVVEWKYQAQDRSIKSASGPWALPSIVRVLSHFKRERIRVKFSRLNIYTRDRFTCQFCGTSFPSTTEGMKQLTFDHVVPRSHGGKTTWENIVTACVACNAFKANRTPAQAKMQLIRHPRKPAYLPSMNVKMDTRQLPEEWKPYWTTTLDV